MSQCVNWLATLNNPEVDPREFLEHWFTKGKANYVVGQLEKGENGTVHIQYFLNFKKPGIRLGGLKKFCSKSHFEQVKINNGAHTYCMKEDTRVEGPWEYGVKPVQRNSKTDWEEVKQHAIAGQLDKVPADIYVKHYANLKRIAKDNLNPEIKSEERDCRWYYGLSGAGKSRKAFEEFPEAYRKMCNKWWDGYKGQEAVIMEDIDPGHKVLGHHLKIWTDRYPFICEAKGDAAAPNYRIFIVTSQYHPSEIFEDAQTQAAILRRFKVTEFLKSY